MKWALGCNGAKSNIFGISYFCPGEYSSKIWEGVCGAILETLTLLPTKICDFLYSISDLTQNSIPYFRSAQELLLSA